MSGLITAELSGERRSVPPADQTSTAGALAPTITSAQGHTERQSALSHASGNWAQSSTPEPLDQYPRGQKE